MDKYAIIVAGGSGTRMGSNLPKQFLLLQNQPVVLYSINAFFDAYEDVHIVLVLPEEYLEMGRSLLEPHLHNKSVIITKGGRSRFESVKNGLNHVPLHAIVFVHDGVRCLVTTTLIKRCYKSAVQYGNAIPAVAAVDTLRIETSTGNQMLDRTKVRVIQTPQTFLSDIIKDAFNGQYRDSFTDDASVVESCGHQINLVEGEITNLKITTQTDLLIAEQILSKRNSTGKNQS